MNRKGNLSGLGFFIIICGAFGFMITVDWFVKPIRTTTTITVFGTDVATINTVSGR